MPKKMISILFSMILVCTAGTACSQSSENTVIAVNDSAPDSVIAVNESVSDTAIAVNDSASDSVIASNAILAEERPLQEIYEADKDNTSSSNNVDPYIPESLDRVVIGEDDRITVSDPSIYPFSTIAFMKVGATCGCTWECTGFMVGPRGLITGAHCLICPKHHATLDWAHFYFGYQSDHNYLYKYTSAFRYWYGTNFRDNGGVYSNEWDYGYVLFDERVGDRVGSLGVSVLSDDALANKYLTAAGYRDGLLKYDSDFASVYSPNVFKFFADTVPGNSGGPVFYYSDKGPYATAIIVSENKTSNQARRITGWLFEDMQSKSLFS